MLREKKHFKFLLSSYVKNVIGIKYTKMIRLQKKREKLKYSLNLTQIFAID